jgi:hypothetical protein
MIGRISLLAPGGVLRYDGGIDHGAVESTA